MATSLVHIRLFTRDPPRMREFYERVLGLPLVSSRGDLFEFDIGGTRLVVQPDPPFGDVEYRDFINQLKGNMRGTGASLHFDVGDVDAYFTQLVGKGIVPMDPEKNRRLDAPMNRPSGRREFAVEDPEGYWLYFGTG